MQRTYLLSALTVLAALAVCAQGQEQDLLAWWKLDDGTGTVAGDSSGNPRQRDWREALMIIDVIMQVPSEGANLCDDEQLLWAAAARRSRVRWLDENPY